MTKSNNKNIQELPSEQTPGQDLLIARGLQKEQYIGITILFIAIPNLMKYTPPALSRTLPLPRGGLGRGNFVSN
ncbi:hypothetical protein H6G54_00400 [Anabaena cylindrica FACHB-243]|uniref:hypothetical protein n=1 Tax=Anabaena TaxID=1163 RepID=UPI0002E4C355|nr:MULTISPECIES: hypothetical protein [Anabaena]MBD2416197.1 hypothetical protein [Anabaena cylindrica FACHB-243]MBY5284789.1 hypothetical protein [Anabaena sp. CCAP 1446/1C]MCM2408924.1 hypothetical protein [Anabaena sp. CCAP 1446/1C]BAY00917.1 hypothetical protein NIES19_01470 [Anabaena cylindrica PCC 7122]